MSAVLLIATVLVPLAMALGCISARWRRHVPGALPFAPAPGLLAAVFAADTPPLVLNERLDLSFALDLPGALLLGASALLWIGAGAYVRAYLRTDRALGGFSIFWLLTLAGSLGVFLAGDLASFYVLYALVSLAAGGLVAHDRTAKAWRATGIYLALAILSEVLLLLGFAMLAVPAPGTSLAIDHVLAAWRTAPLRDLTLGLLVAGFGLKMGLLPLHVWLPIAHPAAPMPASAVLSGAIVKAGVIGLIRFLPGDVLPGWGGVLLALGFATAFYAVAIGVTQRNPKTVLAYSTVSQMGVVATLLGLGLQSGAAAAPAVTAFYAVHHILAKGALFLAVGVMAATGVRKRWQVLLPASVIALGFGGLPLTGGAMAKLAGKALPASDLTTALAAVSAIGSTALMAHFLRRLAADGAPQGDMAAPAGLTLPWLTLAALSVAVPWALYPLLDGGPVAEAWSAVTLLDGLWPVLVGLVLVAILSALGDRLPAVPEGDIIGPALRGGGGLMRRMEPPLLRIECAVRRWPVAATAVVGLVVAFGVAMAAR